MYRVQITHPGLNRVRVVTGKTDSEVEAKVESQRTSMERYVRAPSRGAERRIERETSATEKELQSQEAALQTEEAERAISEAQELLSTGLAEGPSFDWEELNSSDTIPEAEAGAARPANKPRKARSVLGSHEAALRRPAIPAQERASRGDNSAAETARQSMKHDPGMRQL